MVRYAPRTAIRSNVALSTEALARVVPSVFAESAHESRSSRYTYIPTSSVLRALENEGFGVFSAMQTVTRDPGRRAYTKHMLRLRHADTAMVKGGDINEILLVNSHDGASSYKMFAGVFRVICSNGLVTGSLFEQFAIRHTGKVETEVVEAAHRVLGQFEQIEASKDAMKSLQLTSGEQNAFARAALAARYPDKDDGAMPLRPEQVIEARRWDERQDNTLWGTFNRAQENLTQGGQWTNDRTRRARTRAVNGIDSNVNVNRALWTLAEEMRKLKAG